MYFRLCWLNSRYRLAIYLALAVALVLLATLPESFASRSGHWVIVHAATEKEAMRVWQEGVERAAFVLTVLLILAAADLGTLVLGDDPARKNLHFLLTRPKSRSHFIWMGWIAGLSELGALWLFSILLMISVLSWLTGAYIPGRLPKDCLSILILCAAAEGLAVYLSVATGARSGYLLAALVLIGVSGVRIAFEQIYSGRILNLYRVFNWLASGQSPVSNSTLALLGMAAPVFAFLARLHFESEEF